MSGATSSAEMAGLHDSSSENEKPSEEETVVVGIGASAGGLEALQAFFKALPDDIGDVAFVLVQHLAPQYNSMMVELLTRVTNIPIKLVTGDRRLQSNTIYQIAPGSHIEVEYGWVRFRKVKHREIGNPNAAVNVMMCSLAQAYGSLCAGVILSGTGSDGRAGIVRIKEKGGVAFAQDPLTAKFNGMPVEAIGTGLVDFIDSPDKIAVEVVRVAAKLIQQKDFPCLSKTDVVSEMLRLLRVRFHVNFEEYKLSTVRRRIQNRMNVVGFDTVEAYYSELCANTDEAAALYNNILIGVTGFLRDSEYWNVVYEEVLPVIVSSAIKERRSIRVWSAGCSTGEETYSIAILLREFMESKNLDVDFKVYATDIDDVGVAHAGQGLYREVILNEKLKKKYFFPVRGGLQVCRWLRNNLLVTKHNMATDPPFKDMDLIICRNVLIYFDTALRNRVLAGFHFGLREGGFLFLGSSESIDQDDLKFSPIHKVARIWEKTDGSGRSSLLSTNGFEYDKVKSASVPVEVQPLASNDHLNPRALDNSRLVVPVSLVEILCCKFNLPCALVDEDRDVHNTFGDLRDLINPYGSLGLKVAALFRRELGVPINIAVPKALEMGRTVVYKNIMLNDADEEDIFLNEEGVTESGFHRQKKEASNKKRIDLVVTPLNPNKRARASEALVAVVFVQSGSSGAGVGGPNGGYLSLSDTINDEENSQFSVGAKERIIELERTLKATQRSLRETVAQLETSNEDLQSTNEELVASNEELQSTNEELQSVNEELYTVNSEHAIRIEELQEINIDMSNLVNATNIPTVFLDNDLHVRKFTALVKNVMTIRPGDIGRPFDEISFHKPGLSMSKLTSSLEKCLATGEESRLPLNVSSTGSSYLVIIRRCDSSYQFFTNELFPASFGAVPTTQKPSRRFGIVVTFVADMGITPRVATEKTSSSMEAVMGDVESAMLLRSGAGRVLYANKVALELFGFDSLQAILEVPVSSLYKEGVQDGMVRVLRKARVCKLVSVPRGDQMMIFLS